MASEEDQMQVHTPRGTLRSPEPSGTPVLKGRSSYISPAPRFHHLDHAHEPPVPAVTIEEKWEHSEFYDGGGEAAAIQTEYDLCTWNPYASEEHECGRQRNEKEDNRGLAKQEMETTCQQVSVDVTFKKDHNPVTQVWNSLPLLRNVAEKDMKKTGTSFPNEGHLNKAGHSEAAALQTRFTELFHKVTGFDFEDDTVESSHNSRGQAQQIHHFKKKIKDLQGQLAEEKRQRQIVAQRLAEERQASEKISLEKQELWETKLKELQKEKYALIIRLQELEAETPRKRIAKGDETVLLTGQELKHLKQEINEQESLIRGYQIENQKAVERMKELELEAKEKQKLMAEENASLASQLANMQLSVRQSMSRGAGASVESSMKNAGLEAHARELKLRLENEKLLQIIADLERSITEMNAKHHTDARCSTAEQVLLNQELAAEKADLAKRVQEQAELISKLEDKLDKQQMILETRPVSEPAPLAPENGQATSRRIKRVTEQVAEVRSFYIKKIKDLTKKLEEAGQENNKKADTEILKANASHAAQMMKEMKQLREQIRAQASTIKALNDKLLELEKFRESSQDVYSERSSRELAPNTRQKQKEQKTSSKTNETSEVVEADRYQEVLQEAQVLQQERKKMEEKNHTLEERLKQVSQELADLESTPRMLQLKFLKDRIEEMEEHHRQKDIEWQEIVKETKRVYFIEQDMIERKWELALDAKNAEVERFRLELDTILETALKIQASQIQAVRGG